MGSKDIVNGRKLCPWFQFTEACEFLFPLLTHHYGASFLLIHRFEKNVFI